MVVRILAAAAGGAAVGALYAAARRAGLTDVDLAAAVAPGRPVAGRAAQLAAGAAASLPGAWLGRPGRGAAAGLAAGALAARRPWRPREAAVCLAAHAAGGAVAGGIVSRAARRR